MKLTDPKFSTYIDFEVGDHVRISKYKNIFANSCAHFWREEVFVIKKIRNTVPLTYVVSNFNGVEIVERFNKKELQKKNQAEFRDKKVIKGKGNKLYVKWKGCDNSFNSWIVKKISLYKMIYFPEPYTRSKNKKKLN